MMRSMVFAAGLLLVGTCALPGCAGLHSRQQPTQVYVLQPLWPAAANPPDDVRSGVSATSTLRVLRPLAGPGLDTDRIALIRDARRLDYYAASRWPAPLPDFLQSLAIDALRASGKYRAVQPDATAFAADEVLQLEIRRLQAEYAGDGLPIAHVQLVATLGRRSDRSLLTSVTADSSVAASENRMQSVVAAFQSAVGEALSELAKRLPVQP